MPKDTPGKNARSLRVTSPKGIKIEKLQVTASSSKVNKKLPLAKAGLSQNNFTRPLKRVGTSVLEIVLPSTPALQGTHDGGLGSYTRAGISIKRRKIDRNSDVSTGLVGSIQSRTPTHQPDEDAESDVSKQLTECTYSDSESPSSHDKKIIVAPPASTLSMNVNKYLEDGSLLDSGSFDNGIGGNQISYEQKSTRKHDKDDSYDFSIERAKRWADAVKLPKGQWAEAEKDLFFRLAMRGFEPLLPSNWHLDFPTLPDSLFADQDPATPAPVIQALHGTDFRG